MSSLPTFNKMTQNHKLTVLKFIPSRAGSCKALIFVLVYTYFLTVVLTTTAPSLSDDVGGMPFDIDEGFVQSGRQKATKDNDKSSRDSELPLHPGFGDSKTFYNIILLMNNFWLKKEKKKIQNS